MFKICAESLASDHINLLTSNYMNSMVNSFSFTKETDPSLYSRLYIVTSSSDLGCDQAIQEARVVIEQPISLFNCLYSKSTGCRGGTMHHFFLFGWGQDHF